MPKLTLELLGHDQVKKMMNSWSSRHNRVDGDGAIRLQIYGGCGRCCYILKCCEVTSQSVMCLHVTSSRVFVQRYTALDIYSLLLFTLGTLFHSVKCLSHTYCTYKFIYHIMTCPVSTEHHSLYNYRDGTCGPTHAIHFQSLPTYKLIYVPGYTSGPLTTITVSKFNS